MSCLAEQKHQTAPTMEQLLQASKFALNQSVDTAEKRGVVSCEVGFTKLYCRNHRHHASRRTPGGGLECRRHKVDRPIGTSNTKTTNRCPHRDNEISPIIQRQCIGG